MNRKETRACRPSHQNMHFCGFTSFNESSSRPSRSTSPNNMGFLFRNCYSCGLTGTKFLIPLGPRVKAQT